MNILIAEDHEDARLLQETILGSHGHRVFSAVNGAEALNIALTSHPDMIISDIQMPVMDGFEFCRTVKNTSELKGIPFIFYTATFVEPEDAKLALSLGASRFIVKAGDPDEFIKAINETIEMHARGLLPVSYKPFGPGLSLGHMHNERVSNKLHEKRMALADENRALRESEERYALAIEGSNDGIWDRNLVSGETYFSPRWKEMLGYRDDELSNSREEWENRIHPEDIRMVRKSLLEHLEGVTDQYRCEYRMRHKDGSYRWILARGATIRNEHGLPIRIAGSHTDITEKKKEEEEKRVLEARLHQAQKMETIGTLAGGIAHDLNNILLPIMNYTHLALRDLERNGPVNDHLQQVLKASDRARELVRQILTFSRRDASERRVVKLQPIIKEVIKLLRATLPTSIEIRSRISSDCGFILADATQMHQMLMNLAANAGYAMPQGGVLWISLDSIISGDTGDGGQPNFARRRELRLSISDTGCGMDEEVRKRIFDPFFTTKGLGDGTGLGLSVVHGIVRGHGGRIDVRSEMGRGTTFDIFLPCVEKDEEDVKCYEEGRASGTERILLVDDEEDVAMVLKMSLERMGYTVTAITDSTEALDEFRKGVDRFDLVVTDYTMPKMNGPQLAMEMKKARTEIPIILTSGLNQKQGTGDNVFCDVVMKPFTGEDLGATIRRVMDGKG